MVVMMIGVEFQCTSGAQTAYLYHHADGHIRSAIRAVLWLLCAQHVWGCVRAARCILRNWLWRVLGRGGSDCRGARGWWGGAGSSGGAIRCHGATGARSQCCARSHICRHIESCTCERQGASSSSMIVPRRELLQRYLLCCVISLAAEGRVSCLCTFRAHWSILTFFHSHFPVHFFDTQAKIICVS